MKALGITLLGSLFALTAAAEILTFKVQNMHCEACEMAVKKNVCTPGTYATCDAKVVDQVKEIGELRIETKAGQKTKPKDIIDALDKIGYKAEVQPATPAKKGT